MKNALALMGLILGVSAVVMIALWVKPGYVIAPSLVAAGALAYALSLRGRVRRLAWVERTIVNVYDCDGVTIDADTLAVVLDSPEVYAAQLGQRERYSEILRKRYQAGEASDF